MILFLCFFILLSRESFNVTIFWAYLLTWRYIHF